MAGDEIRNVYRKFQLVAGYLTLCRIASIVCSTTQDLKDYCINESFKPQCGPDEVVIIEQALYGRMKIDRCAKIAMGYQGCHADVADLADERCSGRRSCEIRMPDESFERTKPCLELQSYLLASYSCLKVLPVDSSECRSTSPHYPHLTASLSSGRIASVTAQETYCGTKDIPWLIQGPPGSRINLTLTDFHAPRQQSVAGEGGAQPQRSNPDGTGPVGMSGTSIDRCHLYATLVDKGTISEGKRRVVQICGRRTRTQHLMESEGHEVEVQLELRRKNPDYFIIKYEIFGCGNPQISESSTLEREGNKARIGCKESGEKWEITCVDNEWVGKFGNCTDMRGYEIIGHSTAEGNQGRSGATTAAICISTFLAVMILLLLIILFYKRYRRQNTKRHTTSVHMTSSSSHDEVDGCVHHHKNRSKPSAVESEELDYVRPYRSHYGRHHHHHHHDHHDHHHHHHHHAECHNDQDSDYEAAEYEKVGSFSRATIGGKYAHIWEMPLPIPGES